MKGEEVLLVVVFVDALPGGRDRLCVYLPKNLERIAKPGDAARIIGRALGGTAGGLVFLLDFAGVAELHFQLRNCLFYRHTKASRWIKYRE